MKIKHQHHIMVIKNEDQAFSLKTKMYEMARGVLTILQNFEPIDENNLIMKKLHDPLMVETKKSPPPSSPTLVNQTNNSDEKIHGGCTFQPSMVESDEQTFVHEFEFFNMI